MVRCFYLFIYFLSTADTNSDSIKKYTLLKNSVKFPKKTRLMLVRCFNVQVVLHEAETTVVGDRDKRRGRTGQQDIDKSQGFQDTGEHSGILHRSVGWRSQKVCTHAQNYCSNISRGALFNFSVSSIFYSTQIILYYRLGVGI